MATDLSVVNSTRVSFAVTRRDGREDASLIKFLMRDDTDRPSNTTPIRFHIRTPIFVAREWFRHRIGCLTGDAEVAFEDGTTRTMEELWSAWAEGGPAAVGGLPLRVLDEATGSSSGWARSQRSSTRAFSRFTG